MAAVRFGLVVALALASSGCVLDSPGGRIGLLVVFPLALGVGLWWLVRRRPGDDQGSGDPRHPGD